VVEAAVDGYRFDGLVNFRDLGGIPLRGGAVVQRRRLFRSDSLSYASPADADWLLDVAGLATIVDLRDRREVDEFGRGPLASADVTYLPVPCTDVLSAESRSEYYFRLLYHHGPELADLVRRLARPRALPALVHCHIGCDRTGAVSALLLGLAGASDEDIAADYARSTRASAAIRERSTERRRMLGLPIQDKSYYDAWEPTPATMAATLGLVEREWGGMSGWAQAFGLTTEDEAAFRAALVDPA
jgi:protein-tyrosine phosphatase